MHVAARFHPAPRRMLTPGRRPARSRASPAAAERRATAGPYNPGMRYGVLLLALLLGACGLKGDLYLPEPEKAATSSDPAAEPILLWVDRETGHGQGKPLAARIRDAADELAFMAWQLGLQLEPASL